VINDDQALAIGFIDFIEVALIEVVATQVEDSAVEGASSVVEYGENP